MWAMMKRPWFLALKVRAIAPGVICVTVSDVVAREELLLRLLHIDIWRPRLEETHDAVGPWRLCPRPCPWAVDCLDARLAEHLAVRHESRCCRADL